MSLDWMADGLCLQVDSGDAFFPERGSSVRPAKRVCEGCLVREPCLEFTLANNEAFGVWGGMSEQERSRMAGRRRAAEPKPVVLVTTKECSDCLKIKSTVEFQRRKTSIDGFSGQCKTCLAGRRAAPREVAA